MEDDTSVWSISDVDEPPKMLIINGVNKEQVIDVAVQSRKMIVNYNKNTQ